MATLKGMKLVYALLVLSIIFLLPLSSAAQPAPVIQSQNSLQLETPTYDSIQAGKDHRFHVHVINATRTKTNVTTSCYFHFYNQTGWDVNMTQMMEFESYNGIDFAYTVKGGNFSTPGQYAYVIQCNSTNEVGFLSVPIQVTPNGEIATVESVASSTGILFAIAVLFLIAAITFNNRRWLVKTVLYIMTVLFLVMAVNSSISWVIPSTSTTLLSTAYVVLISGSSLMFIVMIIYYLKAIIKATKDVDSERKEDLL